MKGRLFYVMGFARRMSMVRFFSAFNLICVRDLGFPEEHFPVPCSDKPQAQPLEIPHHLLRYPLVVPLGTGEG